MNLSLLSTYRTQLMGIATLMTIICHSAGFGCYFPNSVLKTIVMHGSLGVDIFLFLSGLGCWYSLSKVQSINKHFGGKHTVIQWFRKRMIRIFVPYAICYFILQGIKGILYGSFDFWSELYLFSTLDYWLHHRGYWFIALIIPLYFLAPLINSTLNRCQNRIGGGSLIILGLLILTSIYIDPVANSFNEFLYNAQSAFKRATNFILGMMIAPYCKARLSIKPLKTCLIFISLFSFQVFLREYYGIYIFCNWCLIPILLIFFCRILSICNRDTKAWAFITWMGAASLESYITNGSTQGIARYIASCFPESNIFYGHYVEYALVIVLGLSSAYIFHIWSSKIIAGIKSKNVKELCYK